MLIHKKFLLLSVVMGVATLNFSNIYPMKQQPSQKQSPQTKSSQQTSLPKIDPALQQHMEYFINEGIKKTVSDELGDMKEGLKQTQTDANRVVFFSGQSLALAYHALQTSERSHDLAQQAVVTAVKVLEDLKRVPALTAELKQAQTLLETLKQTVATAHTDLDRHSAELSKTIGGRLSQTEAKIIEAIENKKKEAEELILSLEKRIIETTQRKSGTSLKDKIEIVKAKIEEESRLNTTGQALATVEKERWHNIREIISDQKLWTQVVAGIIIVALCIFTIKYGLPFLFDHLKRPRVISETSRNGLFDVTPKRSISTDDLIFSPTLQNQLDDLFKRVKTAKKFKEPLPNVLFYGAPGTGKTAFAKALAYESGLDYALTSGSEFAKITDLNIANNELRKLLNWAKNSKKGMIIFIDEAESLFADRRDPTTPKITQDFINTFLSLVSEQSQKKLMFIFATNYPYKLDDAVTNRIGLSVEFIIPDATIRNQILLSYLAKFAQKNKNGAIQLHPDTMQMLQKCADALEGFSPRSIKFIAEEMITKARRNESKQLIPEDVEKIIDFNKRNFQRTVQWKK